MAGCGLLGEWVASPSTLILEERRPLLKPHIARAAHASTCITSALLWLLPLLLLLLPGGEAVAQPLSLHLHPVAALGASRCAVHTPPARLTLQRTCLAARENTQRPLPLHPSQPHASLPTSAATENLRLTPAAAAPSHHPPRCFTGAKGKTMRNVPRIVRDFVDARPPVLHFNARGPARVASKQCRCGPIASSRPTS